MDANEKPWLQPKKPMDLHDKDVSRIAGIRFQDDVGTEGRIASGEVPDAFRLFREDIGQEVEAHTMMPVGKYPDLHIDLSKLEAKCTFRDVLSKVCEGGLDYSLAVYAILACAGSCPDYLVQDGTRLNLYVVLLSGVGSGKDTVIDRTLQVFWPSGNGPFTYTSPGGDKQLALILGPKYDKHTKTTKPGPKHLLIVTPELGDTLAKASAEGSSLLEAYCWLKDKPKVFLDAKTREQTLVDCVPSLLAGFPVGDRKGGIDPHLFAQTFGAKSSQGFTGRCLFGFSEFWFDRRRSRNWQPPPVWKQEKIIDMDAVRAEVMGDIEEMIPKEPPLPLGARLSAATVQGWEPGIEAEFLAWEPEDDSGRADRWMIQQVSILMALINGRRLVSATDWRFAREVMRHQAAIRRVFQASIAEDNSSARLNEVVMRTFERMTAKALKDGKRPEDCWIRWKDKSNDGKWYRFGMSVERCIDALVKGGFLVYRSDEGEDGEEKPNTKFVMLASLAREIETRKS